LLSRRDSTEEQVLDFSLNEEQRAWQLKARRFAEEEIRPLSLARDAISGPRDTFDWNIIKRGSQLGFRTAAVPKAWGGAGIDFVTQAIVMAELARADSAISKSFSQCWKWSQLIADFCSEDQKRRFLVPFMHDDTYLLGSASTEPNAGSDKRILVDSDIKSGWRLKAEKRGDEWILNGEKTFIANGPIAKLFFVNTRSNPNVSIKEGTTVFLVPSDTPGFRVGKIFNKSGWRFYQNAELIFEDARVPEANMVGKVHEGFKLRGGGFSDFELAANAVGVCDDAAESALSFAKCETRGGRPLADQQVVQLKLNQMCMLTEALRSFVMRVAAETDGKCDRKSPAANVLVMNFAADTIQRVTELNLDIHGMTGGTANAHADKLVRDAMIWTHLAGDSVQRMKAVDRLKTAASK
jgi:alkylation response protein AidB-like acyl-CoA dehydrogenase